MINGIVASWEFVRGVEVYSPLSGWGDTVHQSSTGSQRFRRARAFLHFLRRSKISLLFLDFLHSAVEQTPSWNHRRRESLSSSSGSAESNASDRALLDLDMVGNVKNVTNVVVVPRLKRFFVTLFVYLLTSANRVVDICTVLMCMMGGTTSLTIPKLK